VIRKPGETRTLLRIALAPLLAAVVVATAGCGADEQFSAGEADRALAAIDAVGQYVDAGRCTQAERRVRTLALQAAHVNSDRPTLGDAYASSVARLQELIARECVEIAPTTPTPETTAPVGPTNRPEPPTPEPTGGGTPAPDNGGTTKPDNGGGNGQNQQPDGGNEPDNSGGAAPGV
jgi:hypothetical protein